MHVLFCTPSYFHRTNLYFGGRYEIVQKNLYQYSRVRTTLRKVQHKVYRTSKYRNVRTFAYWYTKIRENVNTMPISTCGACGLVFTSTWTFDQHRVGTYQPMTRRCLSVDEMQSRGMTRNKWGYWTIPMSTEALQARVLK